MHFWIDKHSQCTYTARRRVPTSLSTGVGRGRGRGKPMAAPVHRFAALEPPPRRPRHHRIHNQQVLPAVHARRHPEDPSLYVEIPPSPAQPTIAHIAAARSVTPDTLLRTAALGLHAPMMAPHLKFGMLVSFALATVFLAGAKYYFDRQRHMAAARSVTPDTLLRTAALGLHAPMMAPHLKFGMLVSFALATVFLAGAKYYFDRQVCKRVEKVSKKPLKSSVVSKKWSVMNTLLRTAALGLHAPMMAPHLKFGMLVSFALATVFLTGAKYYFDRQVSRDASGGEASVVCALVAALAGVGCALSLCRARPPSPVPPERVSSTARHPVTTLYCAARASLQHGPPPGNYTVLYCTVPPERVSSTARHPVTILYCTVLCRPSESPARPATRLQHGPPPGNYTVLYCTVPPERVSSTARHQVTILYCAARASLQHGPPPGNYTVLYCTVPPERVSSTARHPPHHSQGYTAPPASPPPSPAPRAEAPPPYHIAVLLPDPPAYHALS
ncbi:unnamed protein product [Plutella xylostella]|uniref:(diamondback moth) hypothetical protein n=1 Tax=Plutella xylostella TaxID=51655 RepID=A0A8S4DQX4_PLUXY|nr:unnamed protein product [Plutella xylostella]